MDFDDLDFLGNEVEIATDNESAETDNTRGIQTQIADFQVDQESQTDLQMTRGPILSIHKLQEDPSAVSYYTGLTNYSHFIYLFKSLGPAVDHLNYKTKSLGRMNELFLTLIKLRQAKDDCELGILFQISTTTVGKVFNTWINFMFYQFKEIDLFLPKNVVDDFTPVDFKRKFPNTRMVLDATEVRIEKPSKVTDQRATWSSYKNCNTLKTMVGISPRGVVTHISPSYGGNVSDRQIIERSDLLREQRFQGGDSIMADRGILVQDLFASQNVQVNTPTTMRGVNQLPAATVVKDRQISSKRVHVERVIGLGKTFKILQGELDHSRTPIGGRIFFVCFVLCNFKSNIVSKYC